MPRHHGAGEKFCNPLIRPAAEVSCAVGEADMAPVLRSFEMEVRMASCQYVRKRWRSQHGVVARIEKQRRHGQPRQQRQRRRPRPVILRRGKSIERCRHQFIKVPDRADAPEIAQPAPARKPPRLVPCLGHKGAQKPLQVQPIERIAINGPRTRRQIHRSRNGSDGSQLRRRDRFRRKLQREIAAETEADQRDVTVMRCRMRDDGAKVVGGPAVIRAPQTVGNASAAPVIPCQHVPAFPPQPVCHAPDVWCRHAAFQAMRQNRQTPARGFLPPCQIKEIPVGQFQPFPAVPWLARCRKE